jgi:DNA polymerase-3 subunit epsilon
MKLTGKDGEIEYDFIAVDFETANIDFWSVCQIGMAFFDKEGPVAESSLLINPETDFDDFNISIHGITQKMVQDAPKLDGLCDVMSKILTDNIIAHHTAFDRSVIKQVFEHESKTQFPCKWIDSSIMARHTYQDRKHKGYGLSELADYLNIPNKMHHNALNDAQVSGQIVLRVIKDSKICLEDWVENSVHKYQLWGNSHSDLRDLANSAPDPGGPLFGETLVFTGALSITRLEAANLAFKLGCDIDTGVTKKTTILVVGDQDQRRLAGYEKSSKHRKAEDLIRTGQSLRIVGEQDFFAMVGR